MKYVLHILGVLYPDKNKTVKENTDWLSAQDYSLKKECYEKVYGKELGIHLLYAKVNHYV